MKRNKNVKIQAASTYGLHGAPDGSIDDTLMISRSNVRNVLGYPNYLKSKLFDSHGMYTANKYIKKVIKPVELIMHSKKNTRRERRLLRRGSRQYGVRMNGIVVNHISGKITYEHGLEIVGTRFIKRK